MLHFLHQLHPNSFFSLMGADRGVEGVASVGSKTIFFMGEYRYTLEKYNGPASRYTCPNCGKKKVYSRYIDTQTGKHLPERFGRCNREDNCGYHLKPYKDSYANKKAFERRFGRSKRIFPVTQRKPSEANYIPSEIRDKSLKGYEANSLVTFLKGLVGEDIAQSLIQRFQIGTSHHWPGATVFWLIDEQDQVRGGQIALFDEDGHTMKASLAGGEKKRLTSWVHYALTANYHKRGKPIPEWLEGYSKNASKFPCLFGLPQLKLESATKPIAIVEAPKTAIIATAYLPQYIWLAVGAKTWLNSERLSAIRGRKVVLFPDNGAYQEWSEKAQQLSSLARFNVSDLLEQEGVEKGSDLADYLVKYPISAFQPTKQEIVKQEELIPEVKEPVYSIPDYKQPLSLMVEHNPNLERLIDTFSLTII